MRQKEFAKLLLLVFIITIAAISSISYYLYTNKLGQPIFTISPSPTPSTNPPRIPSPIINTSSTSKPNSTLTPKSTILQPVVSPTSTVKTTPKDTHVIKVKGDENCIAKTNEALNLLQSKAQVHYNVVIKYVGVIECANQGSGMYAYESPPRYQVGKATYEAGMIWYAGTITHDSCHSKQYHDYLSINNSASVPSEVWIGKKAERQCLDVQYDALIKIGADQNILDYVKNIINSEYWNVNYDNRWW